MDRNGDVETRHKFTSNNLKISVERVAVRRKPQQLEQQQQLEQHQGARDRYGQRACKVPSRFISVTMNFIQILRL